MERSLESIWPNCGTPKNCNFYITRPTRYRRSIFAIPLVFNNNVPYITSLLRLLVRYARTGAYQSQGLEGEGTEFLMTRNLRK